MATLDELVNGLGVKPANPAFDFLSPEQIMTMVEGTEDPGYLPPMYGEGVLPEPVPVEEEPITETGMGVGMLPAYAQAQRGPLPDPIAAGASPFEDFTQTYLGQQQEEPQDALGQLQQLMSQPKDEKTRTMPAPMVNIPGYAPLKPTAQQMRGQSFMLPRNGSESRLAEAGFGRAAEKSQWLRSLRVKKGYF